MKTTGPSLLSISQKYPADFTYESLKNHVRMHQFQSEDDYTEKHLQKVAEQHEKSIAKRVIESTEVFDEVIGQAMEKLQAGELKVDTKDLLSAAKLKKEFQLKEKDQQLAYMDMVYHFASGEDHLNNAYDRKILEGEEAEHFDPAQEPTADIERRTDQSRAFYQSLTGDAPTPRTD